MKKFLLIAVLLLAACEQSIAQNETAPVLPSVAAVTPSTTCPHQDWVGQKKTDVDMSGVKALRVLYPDQPMTMDYSPDRINVILERGTDIILKVTCG